MIIIKSDLSLADADSSLTGEQVKAVILFPEDVDCPSLNSVVIPHLVGKDDQMLRGCLQDALYKYQSQRQLSST